VNRKNFFKGVGAAGLVSMLPFGKAVARVNPENSGKCMLIPSETPGPFPLDLTDNSFYFRQDIGSENRAMECGRKKSCHRAE